MRRCGPVVLAYSDGSVDVARIEFPAYDEEHVIDVILIEE